MGLSMNPSFGGWGMGQSGSPVGIPLTDPLLMGMGQSGFFAGVAPLGGSTPRAVGGVPLDPLLLPDNKNNNNPFLF